MFQRLSRHAVALLTGGALGIAVTTALEVVTAPYSPAVSAYAFNGVVHLLKVVAVVVFVVGSSVSALGCAPSWVASAQPPLPCWRWPLRSAPFRTAWPKPHSIRACLPARPTSN